MVHEAATGTAVGGVIDHRYASPLQDQQRIAPAQLLELLVAFALVGHQISQVLLAPRGAVGVLQHHLHGHPLALFGHQGFGHLGEGELLHRYQDVLLGGGNGAEHKGFQVVALAPATGDWTAVAVGAVVVEGHLDARGQGQVFGWFAKQLSLDAAAPEQQGKDSATGPKRPSGPSHHWIHGAWSGCFQVSHGQVYRGRSALGVARHLGGAQHQHKPDHGNGHSAENSGRDAGVFQHQRNHQREGQGACQRGKGNQGALHLGCLRVKRDGLRTTRQWPCRQGCCCLQG